jgi:hypothetical protein
MVSLIFRTPLVFKKSQWGRGHRQEGDIINLLFSLYEGKQAEKRSLLHYGNLVPMNVKFDIVGSYKCI